MTATAGRETVPVAERSAQLLLVVAAGGWLLLGAHTVHSAVDHRHPSGDLWAAAAGPAMWGAMVAATMLPSIVPNARFVALRSPRRRRGGAVLDVVTGWAAVWLPVAVVLWAGTSLVERTVGRLGLIAVAFATAAAWQCTNRKRLSVARCGRTFAPPLSGPEARRACRRFGTRLGVECSASCWALMAAMAAGGHRLLVVLPLGWVTWYERRRPHHDPPVAATAAVVAVTGVMASAWLS